MAERKGASSDPSMDEILSSIRKIISDDEARAQLTLLPLAASRSSGSLPLGQPPSDERPSREWLSGPQAGSRPGRGAPEPARREPAAGCDDVLLLTDMIEPSDAEGGSAVPIRLSRIEPARPAERPLPASPPAAKVLAESPPAALPALTPTLVSVATSEVTALALARLSQAVQDSVPPPAAHDPGPAIDGQGKTLEDLVREMLRPMLQDWLDRNLPPMVERHVEREIVRLTRR